MYSTCKDTNYLPNPEKFSNFAALNCFAMRHIDQTLTHGNAMKRHGVWATCFDAFSSKSSGWGVCLNNYKQSHSGDYRRCSFTGKERDGETGFGYFGARYMDHELMTMWLSVDPMADKYPSLNPYNYCTWNPIKLIDPDGTDTIKFYLNNGTFEQSKAEGDHRILYYNYKNGELLYSNSIQEDECSFWLNSVSYTYKEGNKEKSCITSYLLCSDSRIGEQIFKKVAELGSLVEWDYYSIKSGEAHAGELSSSGIKNKMVHLSGMHTAENVEFWNHYHPNNNSESFYPSHTDQEHARELNKLSSVRCTMFNTGFSMDFQKYIPPKGHIPIAKFTKIWNRYASYL